MLPIAPSKWYLTGMARETERLIALSSRDGSVLGWCRGRSPWLGPREQGTCDKPNRLLTRSASNAYFSQTVSVISLPDNDQALRRAIDLVWEDFLQCCENKEDLRRERRNELLDRALVIPTVATPFAAFFGEPP